MPSRFSSGFRSANPLVQRLSSLVALSGLERDFLNGLKQRARVYSVGAEIGTTGGPLAHAMVLVSGWAVRQRLLPNGRCQILSVLLPGDVVGDGLSERPIDRESIIAIGEVQLVSAAPILNAIARDSGSFSGLAQGLLAARHEEEGRLLASLVRIGCQPALERTVDFLVELYQRCRSIGFVHDRSFPMPLTQEMLGNALGISAVHVNRVVAQIKRDGVIEIAGGVARILDLAALSRLSGISLAAPNGVFRHAKDQERGPVAAFQRGHSAAA
jgi:CRP-like cAMP-binding protein